MNIAKFYIKKEKGNDYYFVLKSANNQTIFVGQGYSTLQNCYKGISSVKVNSIEDDHYQRKQTESGEQWYFVLKAANGEIIGMSEMYNSKQAMEGGIDAVKKDADEAPVVEDLDVERKVEPEK